MKKTAKPKIQFHRNIPKQLWSYILPGKPTANCTCAILEGVTLKHPNPDSKQVKICWEGGSRKVFAWFKAVAIKINPRSFRIPSEAEEIFFDPTKGDRFFHFYRPGTPANKEFGGKPGQFKIDYLSKVYALDNSIFGVQ